jgi:hypothetical protein
MTFVKYPSFFEAADREQRKQARATHAMPAQAPASKRSPLDLRAYFDSLPARPAASMPVANGPSITRTWAGRLDWKIPRT